MSINFICTSRIFLRYWLLSANALWLKNLVGMIVDGQTRTVPQQCTFGGQAMLEVTEIAMNSLKSYMTENNIDSPIRVALMQGGWSGPSLGLALDEPKSKDSTLEQDGVTFVVDNDLMQKCGAIKIDYLSAGYRSGFNITSTIPVSTPSSCNYSCGSSSCG